MAAQVAEILVSERASVLTSYDANGGYGHPDHLAVHRAGAPGSGIGRRLRCCWRRRCRVTGCWRRRRAANRLLPRSRKVDLDPWAHAYSSAAEVTHCIDVRGQAKARRASMRAHASQATADSGPRTLGVFTRIPPPLFGWVFGREWYRQAGLDDRAEQSGSPECSTPWRDQGGWIRATESGRRCRSDPAVAGRR